jgi:hypothetical protein
MLTAAGNRRADHAALYLQKLAIKLADQWRPLVQSVYFACGLKAMKFVFLCFISGW